MERERIQMLKNTIKPDTLVFLKKIPVAASTSELSFEDLKKEILDIVVEFSLYKDSELDVLFSEVVRKNQAVLGKERATLLVTQIRSALDE